MSQNQFEIQFLNSGERELLGMVRHADTHQELDLLLDQIDRRRVRRRYRYLIEVAIEKRAQEIERGL